MNLETARLRLEPYDDLHYEGLRVMENDSGMMRDISKGILRDPLLEIGSPNRQAAFSR